MQFEERVEGECRPLPNASLVVPPLFLLSLAALTRLHRASLTPPPSFHSRIRTDSEVKRALTRISLESFLNPNSKPVVGVE